MKNFLYICFPWLQLKNANEKLNDKIQRLNECSSYQEEIIANYKNIRFKDIEYFYDETMKAKIIIEDKAKIMIPVLAAILTFTVSSIIGYNEKHSIIFMPFAILLNVFILNAVLSSLYILLGLNQVNKVSAESFNQVGEGENIKNHYALYTEINTIRNTIRNNYLSVSFECIRNYIWIIFVFSTLESGLFENILKYMNQCLRPAIIIFI